VKQQVKRSFKVCIFIVHAFDNTLSKKVHHLLRPAGKRLNKIYFMAFRTSSRVFFNLCRNCLHAFGHYGGSKSVGLKDYHVVGIAGDGGTADIGIQALSGAIDRRDKIIYVCYDNEAYMNTGIQKSGLTPYGQGLQLLRRGKYSGTVTQKKNMFEIVAAHGIDYAATASIGYIQDFMNKIQKASKVNGTSYIHVFALVPPGGEFLPTVPLT